jgi:hypothetical protein
MKSAQISPLAGLPPRFSYLTEEVGVQGHHITLGAGGHAAALQAPD